MMAMLATTTLISALALVIAGIAARLRAERGWIARLHRQGKAMPSHSFLGGHLPLLQTGMKNIPPGSTLDTLFAKLANSFPGGMYYFDLWPFSKPLLIVTTHDGASALQNLPLDRPDDIQKPMETFSGGPSLQTMQGSQWKIWRELFNPGFSTAYMTQLAPLVAQEAAVFCKLLRQKAVEKQPFILEKLTAKLTLDVIGGLVMDTRLHYQEQDNPLAAALRTQVEWVSFGADVDVSKRYNPIRPFVLWRSSRAINRFIGDEIEKRISEMQQTSAETVHSGRSIMSLVLKNYFDEHKESRSIDPNWKATAISQLRLFLMAGHDTTSSTLIYCYHLLCTNPEAFARIRAEHDTVFGKDRSNVQSILGRDSHRINSLPYTLAVVKETLRLFPPASAVRLGRPDLILTDQNGDRYPTQGCKVWALHHGIHRNAHYWKDPHSFVPERWLVDRADDPYAPVKGAWRPFEWGPRNCIGQTLAVLELKVVLLATVREFEIRPAYEAWDQSLGRHVAGGEREVYGNRAYQVEGRGLGAHPADGYPCTVRLAGEARSLKHR